MFSPADTVVAIATPPGRGGIGVVRISGTEASTIAAELIDRRRPLRPREATFTRALGGNGEASLDHVMATYFPGPHSYTGEDVVEISAHGSPPILHQIVRAAMAAGARLAEPGEFTLRAYLNGRLDLVQAEAVADLVDAVTPLQARAAFDQLEGTLTKRIRAIDEALFDVIARLEASVDFPDEGYHFVDGTDAGRTLSETVGAIRCLLADAARGRLIREGLPIAILGRPNVGKSSLFNCLVGAPRAIVSRAPGTTRDLVSEMTEIEGLSVNLVDTAGIRETTDEVEREGVERAHGAAEVSRLVLLVLDRSRPLDADDRRLLDATGSSPRLVVVNKIDLPQSWPMSDLEGAGATLALSLTTSEGVEALRPAIVHALLGHDPMRDTPAITNVRHVALLERAASAIDHARAALGSGDDRLSEEFVLADLQSARGALEEITGVRAPEDVLKYIFDRFCIGK